MDCPKCGKPMQRGYLCAGGRPIIWTQDERRFSVAPKEQDVVLQQIAFFGKNDVEAYICKMCRKITIDYKID